MIKRDELINFIHNQAIGGELISSAQKIDNSANGVQIIGSEKVEKVVVGVSINMDLLTEAVKSGSQFCIAHHGLGLNDKYVFNSRLNPAIQSQLKFALENNLSIAGYHYVLDNHPVIGNNAVIIDKLGAKKTEENYFDVLGLSVESIKLKNLSICLLVAP
ncbi:Nif3-like dinuclear metal center hexameric protein [Patescibacteria group bacterium]